MITTASPVPRTETARPVTSGPVGLRGWLILPIIGFVGTILLTGFSLSQVFVEWSGIQAILAGGNDQLVALRVPVGLSFVVGLAVVTSAALCLWLLFARRRAVIPVAIAHYVILAMAGLVELWGDIRITEIVPGTPRDPAMLKNAARGVIGALIWAPYFAVSKRVRNTCVEPSDARPAVRRDRAS